MVLKNLPEIGGWWKNIVSSSQQILKSDDVKAILQNIEVAEIIMASTEFSSFAGYSLQLLFVADTKAYSTQVFHLLLHLLPNKKPSLKRKGIATINSWSIIYSKFDVRTTC